MTVANYLTGEDVSASIGGVVYAIKKFTIKFKRPRLEVPNSMGKTGAGTGTGQPGFMTATYGLRSCEVTIEEATFDALANVFTLTNPIQLVNGAYISLIIVPDGQDDPLGTFTNAHNFPLLLVHEVSHEGEVGALQPISFSGETDGPFTLFT